MERLARYEKGQQPQSQFKAVEGAIDHMIGPDDKLKEELGDKYEELGGMVNQMKSNMKRLGEMARRAKPLPIKMQHVY